MTGGGINPALQLLNPTELLARAAVEAVLGLE
jgi:hypothetical protein